MPLTPAPWRTGIVANATTAGNQSDPSITQLNNGNIVVSWTTDDAGGLGSPAGNEIFAQIFDPLGNKIGGEIRLNQNSTDDNEQQSRLAAMPDGGFIVVYEDRDLPANDFALNLRLERYDANGNRLAGNLIVVQDGGQPGPPEYYSPVVAVSSATSALIAYDKYDGSSTGVFGKLFNPTTSTFGAEFQLINSSDSDSDPSIGVLSNGNYVIAVENDEGNVGENRIIYRIIGPTGNSVLGSTEVIGTGNNDDFYDEEPQVVGLAGGEFVIVWAQGGFFNGEDDDIQGRVYNAAGIQAGSFSVGDLGSNESNYITSIAALPDGTFVVSHYNSNAGLILMTHFSASGTQLGSAVPVESIARDANMVGLDDGRFAIVNENDAGEIALNIFDTRNEPNGSGVYAPAQRIVGTTGDDFIFPTDGTDSINGWNGNDTIVGSGGPRQYFGDDGDDNFQILAAVGGNVYSGGAGTNTIDWSASAISGNGASFNLVNGTAIFAGQQDTMTGFTNLTGTSRADNIWGNNAANIFQGGGGNDTMNGLGGDDTLEGGSNADALDGGDGFDYASYASASTAVQLVLYNTSFSTGEAQGDSFVAVEGIHGSGFGDTLVGGFGVDVIGGGDGGDWIDGTYGGDALFGEGGNDNLASRQQADYLDGGAGFDYARYDYADAGLRAYLYDTVQNSGWAAGDTFVSIEGLAGSYFADDLRGDASQNIIYGLGGADFIIGLGGSDLLIGGDGQDLFHFVGIGDGGAGGDAIQDFVSGQDRISVTGAFFGLGSPGGVAIESFRFVAGSTANLATSQFLYNAPTGQFWYDQDGTGAGAQVLLATLQAGATMAAEDIIVL